MLVSGLGGRGAPPSARLTVTAKNTDPTSVMITISHEGGDDLIAADLEVQASDNTGAMHTVSMTTSGGGTTLTVGGKATGTYTYGAGPGGKAITVYVIHNPSKLKMFSNTSVIVARTSLAWNQTTWTGGRTTPTVQAGTWDSSYDKYYVGENENNENGELKIALWPPYENGMKMTGLPTDVDNMKSPSYKTSIRFTAQESKNVDNIRVRVSTKAGASLYWNIGIRADNGSGYPNGTWLDNLLVQVTAAGPKTIDLPNNIAITAGNVYHIVIENGGTPSSVDYIGICALDTLTKIIPYDGRVDNNMNSLWYDGTSWSVKNYDPYYVLDYTDTTYRGQPYYTTFVVGIVNTLSAGENFGVGENTLITGVSFRVSKRGAPADNLYYGIFNYTDNVEIDNGFLVAPSDISTENVFQWITRSIAPVLLTPGKNYIVYIKSPNSVSPNYYLSILQNASSQPFYRALSYYGASSVYTQYTSGVWTFTSTGYDLPFSMMMTHYYHDAYIESSIYDATTTVNWGNVSWNENRPSGTSIVVKVRTGSDNDPYPNDTANWSGWCIHGNNTENTSLPDGRYVQYRIEFSTTDNAATPCLYDITLNYL
jgi:hypothetical protein